MKDRKEDEPRLNYEGYYELTGMLSSASRRKIERKLYEIYDELNDNAEDMRDDIHDGGGDDK